MLAIRMLSVTAVVCALIAGPTLATTVDDVIAKHVEARGGRAAWDRVETMKLTGAFTSFSITSPFTMLRKRDHKFHNDYNLGEWPRKQGFDGEVAWSELRGGGQVLHGLDRSILLHEVEFATSLFDYADHGMQARLLGNVDVEGMPTVGIELTHDGKVVETWYLDPESHLEVARDTTGSDYVGPTPQRTFYDDFRKVGDVTIPHYSDAQWLTRSRIQQIDGIELNVEIDDAVFRKPPPIGMGPVLNMVGTWAVTRASRTSEEEPWEESERVSTVSSALHGAMIEESLATEDGVDIRRTLSFDQMTQSYRMTRISDASMRLDVHQGKMDESGRLVVSNLETGTAPTGRSGAPTHGRFSIYDIDEAGFKVEYETSTDGGESWLLVETATYRRQGH